MSKLISVVFSAALLMTLHITPAIASTSKCYGTIIVESSVQIDNRLNLEARGVYGNCQPEIVTLFPKTPFSSAVTVQTGYEFTENHCDGVDGGDCKGGTVCDTSWTAQHCATWSCSTLKNAINPADQLENCKTSEIRDQMNLASHY